MRDVQTDLPQPPVSELLRDTPQNDPDVSGRLMNVICDSFPGGIALFNPELRMVLCNSRLRAMLDYPASLFENGYPSMNELFWFNARRGEYGPGNHREQVARRLSLAAERCPHHYERTRPNGTVLEVRGMPTHDGGFITTYFDVTEQRRAAALITHLAHHDSLTDLPNRTTFMSKLDLALRETRPGRAVAVHFLDLDGFKLVNDRWGHKVGDQLLVGIAHRLRSSVRTGDAVARLGGDEFAIVQAAVSDDCDAVALARRIGAALNKPFTFGSVTAGVGVSIGIALTFRPGVSADELLSKADGCMYRSKASGGGCHTMYV